MFNMQRKLITNNLYGEVHYHKIQEISPEINNNQKFITNFLHQYSELLSSQKNIREKNEVT